MVAHAIKSLTDAENEVAFPHLCSKACHSPPICSAAAACDPVRNA